MFFWVKLKFNYTGKCASQWIYQVLSLVLIAQVKIWAQLYRPPAWSQATNKNLAGPRFPHFSTKDNNSADLIASCSEDSVTVEQLEQCFMSSTCEVVLKVITDIITIIYQGIIYLILKCLLASLAFLYKSAWE